MSQPDAYSKPEGPYERNHRTRTLSENNPKAFRKDAVRVAAGLNRAGIACSLEYEIIRYGEFNSRGIQKTYHLDVFVHDPRYLPVSIEMEGEGSGSRDNLKRDAYLGKLGIAVAHFANKTSSQEVIGWLDKSFKKPETEFP